MNYSNFFVLNCLLLLFLEKVSINSHKSVCFNVHMDSSCALCVVPCANSYLLHFLVISLHFFVLHTINEIKGKRKKNHCKSEFEDLTWKAITLEATINHIEHHKTIAHTVRELLITTIFVWCTLQLISWKCYESLGQMTMNFCFNWIGKII